MPVHRGDLARSLKAARARAKLTQAGLAEQAGVTDETISRIERAAFEPSLSTVNDIAEALGTSVDALLGRRSGYVLARDTVTPSAETGRIVATLERLPPPTRTALVTLIDALAPMPPARGAPRRSR